ncbi:hypothetical protein VMCG_10729 [Cytospora schulzeri]|uniref:Uncharacterized protein n=1 Tax=Cytospora schulzeri TaxID=448051 RepID=A0A423V8Z0_9PEZI|nr:hypothetical protein VMCG_10729 [Valsa malicola]
MQQEGDSEVNIQCTFKALNNDLSKMVTTSFVSTGAPTNNVTATTSIPPSYTSAADHITIANRLAGAESNITKASQLARVGQAHEAYLVSKSRVG